MRTPPPIRAALALLACLACKSTGQQTSVLHDDAFAGPACAQLTSIADFVACVQIVTAANPDAADSDVLAAVSAVPGLMSACSTSTISAQPAVPEQGDLRCFLVSENRFIASYNLVAGLNEDRFELAEPATAEGRAGVVLGDVDLRRPHDLASVLTRPQGDDDHDPCSMCHEAVGSNVTIAGTTVPLLTPIPIDADFQLAVTHLQIPPAELDQRLADLEARHACADAPATETCRRLALTRAVTGKLPVDDP